MDLGTVLPSLIAGIEPWPTRRALLDHHAAALLSEEADGMLAVIHNSHRHDRRFQQRIEVVRLLLAEARDRGHKGRDRPLSSYFEQVFGSGGIEESLAPVRARPPSPLDQLDDNERQTLVVIETFVLSRSWEERRHIICAYPNVLLSAIADQTLATFAQAVGDNAWGELYADLRRVLATARRYGIVDTFATDLPNAFLHFPLPGPRPLLTRDEAIQFAVIRYTDTPTWQRRRDLLSESPSLLLDDLAVSIIETSAVRLAQTDPELGRRFRVAHDVLDRARTVGVGEAFAPPLPPTWVRLDGDRLRRALEGASDGFEPSRIAMLRSAVHYTDPALAPAMWATYNVALATQLVGIDVEEASLRPIYIEEALERCGDALQAVTAESAPDEWLSIQFVIGRAYLLRERGDRAANIEAAIRCLQQVVEERARAGNEESAALAMVTLAQAYTTRSNGVRIVNLDTAERLCQTALLVLHRDNAPTDWAWAKMTLGQVRFEQRHYGPWDRIVPDVIEHLELALSEPSLDPGLRAAVELQLGLAHGLLITQPGDEHDAKSVMFIEQCLRTYRRETKPWAWATAQHALGVTHFRAGTHDIARQETAEQCFHASLEVFDGQAYPTLRRRTLKELGGLLFLQRRWQECLRTLDEAMALGNYLESGSQSEAGRIAEISEMGNVHERAAYCLLQTGRPAEALTVLDSGKTRLLRRVLGVESSPAAVGEAARELDEATNELRVLLQRRHSVHHDTPEFERPAAEDAILELARARVQRAREQVERTRDPADRSELTVNQIRALIPDRGALIVPLLTSQGSSVFLLTPECDAPYGTILPLGTNTYQELHRLVDGTEDQLGWFLSYQRWRRALDDRNLAARTCNDAPTVAVSEYEEAERAWAATLARVSRRLWTLIGQPVHAHLSALGLPEGAPVVVVSANVLSLLPLHAAWRPTPNGRRYLLDDYTVGYTPSLIVLDACRRLRTHEQHPARLLGIVNPTSDLPFADIEADRLCEFFPRRSVILNGPMATVERLVQTASGQTHLHFACHASFDWLDTTKTGLALARGEWLTVSRIAAELSFDAVRLVVLSACETGLSDTERIPNEYIGLPGAFLQAGAPAVVSSLWRVDDEATAGLMERFYRQHIQLGQEPAVALRRAQQEVRTIPDFEHPFYWAGFSCIGA